VTTVEDATVANISATRDGKRLLFLKQRRQDDVYLGILAANGSRLENARRLTLDDREDWPTGWSRDSRSIYFYSNRQGTNDIFKQGIDDKSAELVIGGPGSEGDAFLSPDASMLLYDARLPGSDPPIERLMRVPISGGPPEMIAELKDVIYFLCPTVPEAACVVAQRELGKTIFYALDPLKGRGRKLGEAASEVYSWGLSSDGARIAFLDQATLRSMRVSDGTVEDLHAKDLGLPSDLAWTSDGRALFVVTQRATGWRISRVGLDGHVDLLRQTDGRRWMNVLLPSPDGRYLAFGQRTTECNAWILENF
jgi:Tol biopolymer transport system component